MNTSKRLDSVRASLTLEVDARAKMLRAEGRDIVGLAAGEPDFVPPKNVVEAAKEAIDAGRGRYTPVRGAPDLRDAIVARFADRGLEYDSDQILVSSGAKQSLFNSLYVLCDDGDEVIIPAPYWTSYPEMARALGVEPVICPTKAENDFRLDGRDVASRITPKTRAIMLNSPGNPTGRVMTKDELEGVADAVRDHDIWVISDDIYGHLTFPGHTFANLAMVAPDLKERCIVIDGMSKAFCMTGWRIGFAAGPADVIKKMATIQGHSTSCASAISQVAATVALREFDQSHLKKMVDEYHKRATHVYESLMQIEGCTCMRPHAAFYAYPSFAARLGQTYRGRVMNTSMDLCNALLDDFLVAIVPGEAFGNNDCLRISYATSMDEIKRGCERIQAFFAEIS